MSAGNPANRADRPERPDPPPNAAEENPIDPVSPAVPWATASLLFIAGLALWLPALDRALIYDRSLILSGQIWRCWTGHFVHFGANHFFWDMVIFVPAGCWVERLWPRRTRWFYLGCPIAISAVLLGLDPALERYAGVSGVAAGVLVLLAGLQLRRKSGEPVWFWSAVLALVAAKVGYELVGHTPLMIDLPESVRVVPLAHVGGIIAGILFQLKSVSPRADP